MQQHGKTWCWHTQRHTSPIHQQFPCWSSGPPESSSSSPCGPSTRPRAPEAELGLFSFQCDGLQPSQTISGWCAQRLGPPADSLASTFRAGWQFPLGPAPTPHLSPSAPPGQETPRSPQARQAFWHRAEIRVAPGSHVQEKAAWRFKPLLWFVSLVHEFTHTHTGIQRWEKTHSEESVLLAASPPTCPLGKQGWNPTQGILEFQLQQRRRVKSGKIPGFSSFWSHGPPRQAPE